MTMSRVATELSVLYMPCLLIVINVSFTQREYNVSEDGGSMIVGVQLSMPPPRRIVIFVVLREISAEGMVIGLIKF